MSTRTKDTRVFLLCVAACALLTSCAAAPQRPTTVNVSLAHVRSAELDAAALYYETTLAQAAAEYADDKLDAGAFRRIYAAGENLHRALTLAHSEHKLYLVAGTNLSAYDAAFAELKRARTNLEVTWSAAHGRT